MSYYHYPKKYLYLLTVIAIIHFSSPASLAAEVAFSWLPNTESNLAGYKIHFGVTSGSYMYERDVNLPTVIDGRIQASIDGLSEGTTYYFAATAYDASGVESDYSTEIVYSVPTTNPIEDSDNDGLSDYEEINLYHTLPNVADSDKDGMNDGEEVAYWQANGSSWDEDIDDDGIINILDSDANNDGIIDGVELQDFTALEGGEVNIDHNWARINFTSTYSKPVVIVRIVTLNDSQPCVIRVNNVDSRGFDIRLQEYEYLDGSHISETVSYFVMEAGAYTLENGTRLEAGTFNTSATGVTVTRQLMQKYSIAPVVLTSITSFNESDAVTGRIRNIDTTGFNYMMQEQEANIQAHSTETISYIAWEPGFGTQGDLRFEVDTTTDTITDDTTTIGYTSNFSGIPITLAGMQTTDGSDPSRLQTSRRTTTSLTVHVEEEQSQDIEIDHTAEVAGYIAIHIATTDACVCTASTMYIESIIVGTARASRGRRYGDVMVTVFDDYGKPVVGATVTGTFDGDFNETSSGVTDNNGVAVIRTSEQIKKPLYEFCVNSVDKESLEYNSEDDIETCKSN